MKDELGRRFSFGAVGDGVFFEVIADFGFGRCWRRSRELADGLENCFERRIVFLLQVGQFASQLGVSYQGIPLRQFSVFTDWPKPPIPARLQPVLPISSESWGGYGGNERERRRT